MSIISQALKKAQREQRAHNTQPLLLPTLANPSRPQRRVLFLLTLGCGFVLGMGALLHAWRTPSPTPATAVMRVTIPPLPSVGSKPFSVATPPPAMVTLMQGTTTALPSEMAEASHSRPEETTAHPNVPTLPAASPRPEAQTHFNLAFEAQAAGDVEQAMALLQQAVRLDPTLKRAYNSLGNLYYQRQQYDDAVAMYHQALTLDPDYVQARNNLGSAYIQLSQYERAIAELQKVLQAGGEASLAYYNLACIYARRGDSAQAVHYLQRAMEIEPQARIWAQTDADFSRIRSEPALQRLLGSS